MNAWCHIFITLALMVVTVSAQKKCTPTGDPEPSEVPLTTEPVPQTRIIAGSCRANISACPIGYCRYDTRIPSKCPPDGVWCSEVENREVDCGVLGSFKVQFVTSCTCCYDAGIKINGIVADSQTGSPLKKVLLRINRKIKAKSDSNGGFSAHVPTGTTRVVLQASMRRGNYIATTKVVEIPSGVKGPISVRVSMVQIAEPIKINSEEDNKIVLETGQTQKALVGIRAGSFRTKRDNYTGIVVISTNYIDPSNRNVEDVIPGQFLTGGRRSMEPLVTDGMFALTFRGEKGQVLKVDNIVVQVQAGMRLWTLDNNGIWQPLASESRKKRQITLTDEFIVNLDSAQWVNIDKIPTAPRCYFKARVFDELTDSEILTSATATFRPEAVGYTQQNQRLRFYLPSTNTPASTCHEVRCPDISDPDDTLIGFISMKSYETVSIGGIIFPIQTALAPRELLDYPINQPRLAYINYEVVPDNEAYLNFISDIGGPFFTTLSKCEASTVTEASFHFIKSELPSYIPAPADIDICTARIGLGGSGFIDTLDTFDPLPTVSALSTWEESGTVYYYTDTSSMGCSTIGGDFAYVCIKYRCSTAASKTTVRIDLDIPMITLNSTGRDIPAFYCRSSECVTDDCQKADGGSGVSIDGSFEAPIATASGADFFPSSPNDCADRAADEPFALTFQCYASRTNSV